MASFVYASTFAVAFALAVEVAVVKSLVVTLLALVFATVRVIARLFVCLGPSTVVVAALPVFAGSLGGRRSRGGSRLRDCLLVGTGDVFEKLSTLAGATTAAATAAAEEGR